MMADSQPLSGTPEGAEYLRAVLRAPVYEAAQVTPLQKMEKLSSRLDNVILVKREDRQPVHSFKLRGAYAMMAGLTEEQKAHGVITASAGNHAQGVAFSSARLGVKALIVMPTATADIKVDAVRGFGGEVLLHGANFDEAKAKAIELSQQQGFTWVPPFDHPMVIAGQGTLALELLQQDSRGERIWAQKRWSRGSMRWFPPGTAQHQTPSQPRQKPVVTISLPCWWVAKRAATVIRKVSRWM